MKLNENIINVSGNLNTGKSTRMSFDERSIAHVIKSLTDMYSDPVKAIIREYAGNAYDSHILANQDKPVQLTLPTALDANFVIRDHGVGMSRDELDVIYSKYGASTKRESNDQIGAFGLGAKSALAITNSFTVVSIKDGKKNTVIVSKDETGVGNLHFLPELDTDAANGVTITIPVPEPRLFQQAINGMFVGWPAGMIEVDGKPIDYVVSNTEFFAPLNNYGYLATTVQANGHHTNAYYQFNSYQMENTAVEALVGPVRYEIPGTVFTSIMKENETLHGYSQSGMHAFVAKNIILNLPNGSVDLTPSREELIYNDRTKQVIVDAYTNAVREYVAFVEKQVNGAGTERDALIAFLNYRPKGVNNIDLTWNGKEFPKDTLLIAKDENNYKVPVGVSEWHGKTASHNYFNNGRNLGSSEENVLIRNPYRFQVDEITRIIVTDATPAKDAKDNYPLAKNLVNYRNAYRTRVGEQSTEMVIYTTSLSKDELNPWFTAIATEIVTEAEAQEVIRAYRRAVDEARRANTDTAKAPKKGVSLPIAVATGEQRGRYATLTEYTSRVTEVNTLGENVKYVVIQDVDTATAKKNRRFGVTPAANFDNLEAAIYGYLRGSNGQLAYTLGRTMTESAKVVVNLLAVNGYTVVSLPVSRNKAQVENKLGVGNVFPLNETLENLVINTVDSLTEVEKEWVTALNAKRSYENIHRWIPVLTAPCTIDKSDVFDFDAINDADSRELIKLGTSNRGHTIAALNAFKILQNTVTDLRTIWDSAAADKLTELFQINTPIVHDYSMLNNMSSTADKASIIEYINLKDAARNA